MTTNGRPREMRVVAVGGPGDGRRYTISEAMKGVRLFRSGPMRGNMVSAGIALVGNTYVDYDLAEFGIQGEASVYLLKPVGSTLVDVMGALTMGYAGLAGGPIAKAAMDHTVGLLRRARGEIAASGWAVDSKSGDETAAAIDKFFAAYDGEKTTDQKAAPWADPTIFDDAEGRN